MRLTHNGLTAAVRRQRHLAPVQARTPQRPRILRKILTSTSTSPSPSAPRPSPWSTPTRWFSPPTKDRHMRHLIVIAALLPFTAHAQAVYMGNISGTLTTGGTAQNATGFNPNRRGC